MTWNEGRRELRDTERAREVLLLLLILMTFIRSFISLYILDLINYVIVCVYKKN